MNDGDEGFTNLTGMFKVFSDFQGVTTAFATIKRVTWITDVTTVSIVTNVTAVTIVTNVTAVTMVTKVTQVTRVKINIAKYLK